MTPIAHAMQGAPARRFAFWAFTCACTALLSACGGGGGDVSVGQSPAATSVAAVPHSDTLLTVSVPKTLPGPKVIAQPEEGARLNTAELETIAKTGVLPKPYGGPLLSGAEGSTPSTLNNEALNKSLAARKSAASRVPVYRFFNTRTSAHFFTTSETERANLVATQPFMTYEGPAFYASSTPIPGLSPVHRFYNTATGVHFYTISESERALTAATLPTFTYEGIGYYASTLPGTGYTPLYRFFYTARGFHFYTNSESEKNTIIATLPQYSYEGIGYYALGSDWQTPAIPHTGIATSQCFQAGSNSLVDCSSAGAVALNPQQDGHRAAVNPMAYAMRSTFYGSIPVTFPLTDCVEDRVSGLFWEGKTVTGTRGYLNNYTYANAPTYVATVNSLQVCAFNDWRLPTLDELHGIVNYGVPSTPSITTSWFPNTNTSDGLYWTSSEYKGGGGTSAWLISFGGFGSYVLQKSNFRFARLVRGTVWAGQRYLVTSQPFPGDGANNAVVDRKTGLTWRRCLQGQTWNGSACIGVATTFTHEAALAHARVQAHWRLPNIKELGSVMDLGRNSPALDPGAFPGATGEDNWSSTPMTYLYTGYAWYAATSAGWIVPVVRSNTYSIRLVWLE